MPEKVLLSVRRVEGCSQVVFEAFRIFQSPVAQEAMVPPISENCGMLVHCLMLTDSSLDFLVYIRAEG